MNGLDRDPQARTDVFVRESVCLAQKIDLPIGLTEFGGGLRVQAQCFRGRVFLLAKPILYNFRLGGILHIVLDLSGFTAQPSGDPSFCNAMSE